jgi:transposase InsO family protein
VRRDFSAIAPNQLWVTDLTYVPTWAGVAYVCFIVDAFSRMIIGWPVAAHMRNGMVLDALDIARWSRGTRLEGLVAHSDAGSQFTSIRYGERLAELGAQPSIGSVGDSYDNALAETVNGLYNATCRVRNRSLRCARDHQRNGWNPIARASMKPTAIQVVVVAGMRSPQRHAHVTFGPASRRAFFRS